MGSERQTPRWDAVDLAPFLARVYPSGQPRISNAKQLTGGASKDVWRFDVEFADAPSNKTFVLRRAAHIEHSGTGLGIEGEYRVMRAAFESGVRVPRPHYQSIDADGFAFFVMDFVEGETLPPRLFRDAIYAEARAHLPAQLGELLAPIHAVAAGESLRQTLGPPPTSNPAALALAQYEEAFRRVARGPHAVFEIAFRHLESTPPFDFDVTLVHGDYRLGNVIAGPEGIRGILDWELSHWGDPMEDLAWPAVRAWRFGRDHHPVAGLGARETLHEAYERASGRSVDSARAHWWEVFGNLRWGVMTLIQAERFLSGATRDVEKAAIGRRAAEVEAELLNLIRD